MALDMFKESLKFQAAEKKQTNSKQLSSRKKAQSWSERGRSTLVKAQLQTLEEASSQTENGI